MADDDGTDSDEDFSAAATTPTMRLRGVLHPLHDQLSRSLDGQLRRAYSTPTIHPVLRSPPVSSAAGNCCAHNGGTSTEERLALSEARIEQLERELASVSDTLGMVVMALRVGTPLSLMEAAAAVTSAADDSDTAAAAAIDGAAMSSDDEDFGDGAAADNDDDTAVVRPWYETVRRQQQQQQQEFTTT
jgi:hypothetical protein